MLYSLEELFDLQMGKTPDRKILISKEDIGTRVKKYNLIEKLR